MAEFILIGVKDVQQAILTYEAVRAKRQSRQISATNFFYARPHPKRWSRQVGIEFPRYGSRRAGHVALDIV